MRQEKADAAGASRRGLRILADRLVMPSAKRKITLRRSRAKMPMSAADNSLKVTRDYSTNPFSRKPLSMAGSRVKRSTRNTFAKRSGR